MEFELAAATPAKDRRVRRSRAALIQAAIALVTERGTAAIPISDIAAAADVSRQLVYQHFGDRDALLLEAALDLARTELLPRFADVASPEGRERALALTRHFAEHRVFYRAMLNSSSAYALTKALSGLIIPVNRRAIDAQFAEEYDPQQLDDLAVFVTGGGATVVNAWVTDADDPLDPEDLADRLIGLLGVITGALRRTAASEKETDR
ncbi:TetR-like C-terminal domain-containing protein [Nocardioides sp. YIM B13467]|uniref:TetR/AcrR family transcriptional regulator n=1 Tax=Nocardioides sp. YIM B13467 TaxID=3366294 RepID=UPI00366C49BF